MEKPVTGFNGGTTAPHEIHDRGDGSVTHFKANTRLFFIDNIRVFLTILVLLHHLMIIYSGAGSWIYLEGRQDTITEAVGSWFCTVNQAYFMGLFLLISAYFVPGSYDRKGAGRFLKDRLMRLGIPLAVYSWILRPALLYAGFYLRGELQMSIWQWFPLQYFKDFGIIGGGPLWFIETLLIFSVVYILWRLLTQSRPAAPIKDTRFPSNASIALFALFLGAVTFLVRLWRPIGWSFAPLNLQLPYFAQYTAMFVVGLIAYRHNWFSGLPEEKGRLWLRMGILLILLFPPIAFVSGAIENDALFRGGWHWQAFVLALWESFLCLAMCIGLIHAFRRGANRQGRLATALSRNAYTAYLIHEPVIVLAALAVEGVMLYPLLKFIMVGLVAVPLTFAISTLIRKIPFADRVL